MKKRKLYMFVCCVVVIILLFTFFLNKKHNKDNEENIEIPLPQLDSNIDMSDEEIGFCYYVYKDVYRYATEAKANLKYLDVEDVVERYLLIAEIDDISLEQVKEEKVKTEKTIAEGIYQPDCITYNVYLKGENLEPMQLNGMISTILSYADTVEGVEYVKIFLNNRLQTTSEQMPNQGYFIQKETSSIEVVRDKAMYEKNKGTNAEFTFVLKDENGIPMKNVVYYVEGSDVGENITNSTGEIKLSVKTNNQYTLRLQKKNSIVYGMYGEEASIYEEMVVCFDVKDGFEQELIWKDEYVIDLSESLGETVIDVKNFIDKSYEEVLVSVNKNGAIYKLGYCEDDGTIIWNDCGAMADEYIVILAVDGNEKYFEAKANNGNIEIIKETLEEPKVAE